MLIMAEQVGIPRRVTVVERCSDEWSSIGQVRFCGYEGDPPARVSTYRASGLDGSQAQGTLCGEVVAVERDRGEPDHEGLIGK
ncbi:hypothetical protein [Actinophytocola sp.]|uniref:hypothetical protein n=1 Tax=Actinophytocola sp. TaxID=1872138 RepID=UPI003D6B43F4